MPQNAKDTDSHIGRRLKLRDLQILASVAQHGSMAKAAAQLSTTQPTVSRPPPQAGARLNARALTLHRARRSRQRCGHPDVQAAEFGRLAVLRSRRHGKKLSVPWQFDNVPQVKFCIVRQPGCRIGRLVLGFAYGEFTGQRAIRSLRGAIGDFHRDAIAMLSHAKYQRGPRLGPGFVAWPLREAAPNNVPRIGRRPHGTLLEQRTLAYDLALG